MKCIIMNVCSEHVFLRSDWMISKDKLSIEQKLMILSDAAKYDVACTSSE